jgi:hypothetical protein
MVVYSLHGTMEVMVFFKEKGHPRRILYLYSLKKPEDNTDGA